MQAPAVSQGCSSKLLPALARRHITGLLTAIHMKAKTWTPTQLLAGANYARFCFFSSRLVDLAVKCGHRGTLQLRLAAC